MKLFHYMCYMVFRNWKLCHVRCEYACAASYAKLVHLYLKRVHKRQRSLPRQDLEDGYANEIGYHVYMAQRMSGFFYLSTQWFGMSRIRIALHGMTYLTIHSYTSSRPCATV
eukprot:6044579-Amphidinium_carterae.1